MGHLIKSGQGKKDILKRLTSKIRCGCTDIYQAVFIRLTNRLVTWGALILEKNRFFEALEMNKIFGGLLFSKTLPDSYNFMTQIFNKGKRCLGL